MAVLLIAEHDNKSLKDSTAKAMSAAKALNATVDILVAGHNAKGVAEAAAKIGGASKVLLADDPQRSDALDRLEALEDRLKRAGEHERLVEERLGVARRARVAARRTPSTFSAKPAANHFEAESPF